MKADMVSKAQLAFSDCEIGQAFRIGHLWFLKISNLDFFDLEGNGVGPSNSINFGVDEIVNVKMVRE